MQLKCMDCGEVVIVDNLDDYRVMICWKCLGNRGLTPAQADIILKEDKRISDDWMRNVSIWEACSPDLMRLVWEQCETYVANDSTNGYKTEEVARRFILALNVMWFGPENLIR